MSYIIRKPNLYTSIEPVPASNGKQFLYSNNGSISWLNTTSNDYQNFTSGVEFVSSLPSVGETNKLYINTSNNNSFHRYSGTWSQIMINTSWLQGNINPDVIASGLVVGDILYCDTNNALHPLGIGANGQVLTVNSGLPSWANTINGLQETNSYSGVNKTLSFTNTSTTTGHNMNITIQSAKKAVLNLISDSDNVGETADDMSMILLSSDNGSSLGHVGMVGSSGNVFTLDGNLTSIDNSMFINSNQTSGIALCASNVAKLVVRSDVVECAQAIRVPRNDTSTCMYGFLGGSSGHGINLTSTATIRIIQNSNTVCELTDASGLVMSRRLNMNAQRFVDATFSGTLTLSGGVGTITQAQISSSNCVVILNRMSLATGADEATRIDRTGELITYARNSGSATITTYRKNDVSGHVQASNDDGVLSYTVIFLS